MPAQAEFIRLSRTLPGREVTVLHNSAQSPHLVSISATVDPSLKVANAPLTCTTRLARRLCITQNSHSVEHMPRLPELRPVPRERTL